MVVRETQVKLSGGSRPICVIFPFIRRGVGMAPLFNRQRKDVSCLDETLASLLLFVKTIQKRAASEKKREKKQSYRKRRRKGTV